MRSSAERVEPPLKPDWREHGGQAVLIVRDSRVRRAHHLIRLPSAWPASILSVDTKTDILPRPAGVSCSPRHARLTDWMQPMECVNT